MEQQRLFYLDGMRSFLMMLGVVLHSSQIFNPEKGWIVYSEHTTPIAYWLIEAIHWFRMPAFFLLSGFFCALTLTRYSLSQFVKFRILRIVVPFIFVAIALNTVQIFLQNTFFGEPAPWLSFFTNHKWVYHLWFLINLVMYFSFTAAVFYSVGTLFNPLKPLINKLHKVPVMAWMLLLPLVNIAVLALNKINIPIYETVYGGITLYAVLDYAVYFLSGILMFTIKGGILKFSSGHSALSMSILVAVLLIKQFIPSTETSFLHLIANEYLLILSVWLSIRICFQLFKQFSNVDSPLKRWLSEASYTVYLVHHLLVIALGLILIKLEIAAIPGLLLLILLVMTLSLLWHKYIVLQFSTMRFLFNGK